MREDDALDVFHGIMVAITTVIVAVFCCSCADRPPRHPYYPERSYSCGAAVDSGTAPLTSAAISPEDSSGQ